MRLPSDAVAFGSDELSDRQPDAAGSFPRVDPPQQASRRLACGSLHTSVRVRGGALVLGRGARRRTQRGPAPALPARAWAAARASDVTGIAGFSGQAEDRLRRGRRGWGEPKAPRTAPLLPSPSAGRLWRPGGSDAPAAGPPHSAHTASVLCQPWLQELTLRPVGWVPVGRRPHCDPLPPPRSAHADPPGMSRRRRRGPRRRHPPSRVWGDRPPTPGALIPPGSPGARHSLPCRPRLQAEL